jgi:hypothetical protein
MKMGKLARVAGAVADIARSDNPAEAAGNLAAGAASVAHPVVGTMAAPLIKKGVTAAVQKGIDTANDPEVQAKAKEIGGEVVKRGRSAISGLASRAGELASGLGRG